MDKNKIRDVIAKLDNVKSDICRLMSESEDMVITYEFYKELGLLDKAIKHNKCVLIMLGDCNG